MNKNTKKGILFFNIFKINLKASFSIYTFERDMPLVKKDNRGKNKITTILSGIFTFLKNFMRIRLIIMKI